uniref:Dehydrogenase/reductase (SDR family) member 9 n=1 Tax=Sinocyclocheilus anshuiensis TaxID=1608454 RepID=A0A671PYQ2_9TELE
MLLYIVGLIVLLYVYLWFRELGRKFVFITGCDTGFGNLLKGEVELKKCCSDKLTTLHLDVTNNYSIKKAADTIKTLVGEKGLWAVVNNAGISFPTAPNDLLEIEDFKQMFNVNLIGVVAVTPSVLPLIKKAKGRVVNVASVFGRISTLGGAYCITKYGVEAFNDSLRRDMMHFGVNGSITEPGFFKTQVTDLSLTEDDLKKWWSNLPTEVRRAYGDSYLQDYIKLQEFSMKIVASSDLSKVTSCMQHALSARYPQTCYSLLDSPLVPAYDFTLQMVVESKNAMKCIIFCEKVTYNAMKIHFMHCCIFHK